MSSESRTDSPFDDHRIDRLRRQVMSTGEAEQAVADIVRMQNALLYISGLDVAGWPPHLPATEAASHGLGRGLVAR